MTVVEKALRVYGALLQTHSLNSSLQFDMYKENVICQREVCLPAAEAFTFSSPAGRLGELSHSIKA